MSRYQHASYSTLAIGSLVALIGLALATPQWAHADRYELSIGSAARFMPSSSVDSLSEDNLPVFSMTAAVAIDSLKIPFFDRFYIDGSFDVGTMPGTSFQTLETEASLMHWALGARLTRDLGKRVAVHGRASLGLAKVGVTIDDPFMEGPTLGDSGMTGTGYLGLASDLIFLRAGAQRSARFTMGLRAEVGYLAMLPKSLEARPDSSDHPEGAILIPEMSASLGDLDMSAWNMRFGLFGRF